MNRAIICVLVILGLLCAASGAYPAVCKAAKKGACPPRLNVLFVVGGPHHDSPELYAMLKMILEDTGDFAVNVTYDRNEFAPANISQYDLVLIYTTGHDLTPEQEHGLIGFVEKGGGLVGIHSATDSFKNSDAYWQLMGGRFTGHGGATFTVKLTGKRHVICETLSEFEITDETYMHAFHPKSKLVTLMRREMDGEPVSWVQYVGKGRVFVTGLGHGKEAWSNPAFQQMITRALLWANGRLNP